uniref:Uncharacterized protein n=1 Tax=Pedobesia claviformis TaxID=2364088 RepID=A0A386B0T0_9CHLO|nr:hypothetical protein [Pedobesia claviformis]AYC65306.1 hypothetical protein [Pedobesia claviformis]
MNIIFDYLVQTGFLRDFFRLYFLLISMIFFWKFINYFLDNWWDILFNYLKSEWNKEWFYESDTDDIIITGLRHHPNLAKALGRLTAKVKETAARMRQEEIEKKEKIELEEKLEKEKLERWEKNPPTEEELKREVKQLIQEMKEKYFPDEC